MIETLLVSIEKFITAIFPECTVIKQNVPKDPKPNTFVIRMQSSQREMETGASSIVNKGYQVIFYGADVLSTLTTIDKLDHLLFSNLIMIPIEGTDRYIRINSFSYSEALKTDNNVDMILGILETTTREVRDLPTPDLLKNFNIRIK